MINDARKIYSGLDLFKLFAAVMVVLLHAIETSGWYPNEIKFVFTRFAVPFFFMTSGFFFFKGLDNSSDKKAYFIKYEKKLIRLFVIWAIIIYSPFVIISYVEKYTDAGLLKTAAYLFRRIFVIGPGPYWYLLVLILSSFFLYICYKSNRTFILITLIVIGFSLEIAYSCFRGVLSEILFFKKLLDAVYFLFSWEYNFIMFGIPFMGMGYLIAKYNHSMKKRRAVLILILTTVMRIVEYNLPILLPGAFWENDCISVFFIFQAYAFFMLGKEVRPKLDTLLSTTIREFSSFIYFLHVILLYEVLNPLLKRLTHLDVYGSCLIPAKVLFVIGVCSILFLIIKKIDNKYLNIIING